MESQRFEKSRGVGVLGALPVPNGAPLGAPMGRAKVYPQDELLRGNKVAGSSPFQPLVESGETPLCQYRDARGRGCRKSRRLENGTMTLPPDSRHVYLPFSLAASIFLISPGSSLWVQKTSPHSSRGSWARDHLRGAEVQGLARTTGSSMVT